MNILSDILRISLIVYCILMNWTSISRLEDITGNTTAAVSEGCLGEAGCWLKCGEETVCTGCQGGSIIKFREESGGGIPCWKDFRCSTNSTFSCKTSNGCCRCLKDNIVDMSCSFDANSVHVDYFYDLSCYHGAMDITEATTTGVSTMFTLTEEFTDAPATKEFPPRTAPPVQGDERSGANTSSNASISGSTSASTSAKTSGTAPVISRSRVWLSLGAALLLSGIMWHMFGQWDRTFCFKPSSVQAFPEDCN